MGTINIQSTDATHKAGLTFTGTSDKTIDANNIVQTSDTTASIASGKVVVDTSGNVGIGTSSPIAPLTIGTAQAIMLLKSSTTTNASYSAFSNTASLSNLYVGKDNSLGGYLAIGTTAYSGVVCVDSAYPLHFATNNTVRATIDSSGNVGIGTSSPSKKLHISESSGSAALELSSDGAGGCDVILRATRSGSALLGVGSSNGSLSFGTGTTTGEGSTERMRIDASGDVWFGAYNRSSNGYTKLNNGLILQWGYGNGTVTFPIAFPNQGFSVMASKDASFDNYATVYGLSKTSCVIRNGNAWWFAIGY